MDYREKALAYKEAFVEDVITLSKIKSVEDFSTKAENAPFGKGVRESFDAMIDIAKRENLKYVDYDGYVLELDYGTGDEVIAVLGHLDVVPEGNPQDWTIENPYDPVLKDNKLYGRGVADDKGPTLAAMYALKILIDEGLTPKKTIRFILGGAEETSWKCMEHYFDKLKRPQPEFGFTPDASFPLVTGEKGLLISTFNGSGITNDGSVHVKSIKGGEAFNSVCDICSLEISTEAAKLLNYPDNTEVIDNGEYTTLIFKGQSAHGMAPQKGVNAIDLLMNSLKDIKDKLDSKLQNYVTFYMNHMFEDYYGEKMGIGLEHDFMGKTSFNIGMIVINEEKFYVGTNPRFVYGTTAEEVIEKLEETVKPYNISMEVLKNSRMIYFDDNNPFIGELKLAYSAYRNDPPISISTGGGTYAKALDNGIAFGPFFPEDDPKYHSPKEELDLDSMMTAIAIYAEALKRLAF